MALKSAEEFLQTLLLLLWFGVIKITWKVFLHSLLLFNFLATLPSFLPVGIPACPRIVVVHLYISAAWGTLDFEPRDLRVLHIFTLISPRVRIVRDLAVFLTALNLLWVPFAILHILRLILSSFAWLFKFILGGLFLLPETVFGSNLFAQVPENDLAISTSAGDYWLDGRPVKCVSWLDHVPCQDHIGSWWVSFLLVSNALLVVHVPYEYFLVVRVRS